MPLALSYIRSNIRSWILKTRICFYMFSRSLSDIWRSMRSSICMHAHLVYVDFCPKFNDVCLRIECPVQNIEHLRLQSAQQNITNLRYTLCQDVVNTSTQSDDAVVPMPQAHRAYRASNLQTRIVNSSQQQAHCKLFEGDERSSGNHN